MKLRIPEKDTKGRAILKSITWRILATLTTIVIVFALTGHIAKSLGAGAIEVVAKFLLYYFHERFWSKIKD